MSKESTMRDMFATTTEDKFIGKNDWQYFMHSYDSNGTEVKPSLDAIDKDKTPKFGSAHRLYEHMQETGTVMMYGHFYEMDQQTMDKLGFEKVYDSLDECLEANPTHDTGITIGLSGHMNRERNGAELVDELSEHDCMIGPDGAIYRVPEELQSTFRDGLAYEYKPNDGLTVGSKTAPGESIYIPSPKEEINDWKRSENKAADKYYDDHNITAALPFPNVPSVPAEVLHGHNPIHPQPIVNIGEKRLTQYGDPSENIERGGNREDLYTSLIE